MIPRLPGWAMTDEGDGSVELHRRDAELRYVERNRPLRTIAEAARDALAGETIIELGDVEELITTEGEYGGVARARIARDGTIVQRSIGGVLGDDFYSLADLTSYDLDRFDADHAELATLVRHDGLGLGLRRRRMRHVAPPRWTHVRRGIADSYEVGAARIRVYPARPAAGTSIIEVGDALAAELASVGLVSAPAVVESFSLASGLAGVWLELAGMLGTVATHHAIAVLDDGRYLYVAREDAPAAEFSRGHLMNVVESIEPIPHARARLDESAECFAYLGA